jgi:MFS family permease
MVTEAVSAAGKQRWLNKGVGVGAASFFVAALAGGHLADRISARIVFGAGAAGYVAGYLLFGLGPAERSCWPASASASRRPPRRGRWLHSLPDRDGGRGALAA